jgi:hypothetical protein
MKIPVLSQLVSLIEELFKAHGQDVMKAAGEAAAGAALSTVEVDPKVAAVTTATVALLSAAQSLKTAIDNHQAANPTATDLPPVTTTPAK